MRNKTAYAQLECYNLQGKIKSGIITESHFGIGKDRAKILLDPRLRQLHSKRLLSGIFAAVGDQMMGEVCPLAWQVS